MKRPPVLLASLLLASLAGAQEPPPSPQSIEPRVDTSARPAAPAGEPRQRVSADEPAPAATPPQAVATPRAQGSPRGTRGVMDRIELDTTQITGNRELPKVLYIVPWKQSDLGDLMGRPANSLLDEVLAPVDREVFRRENRYYDALQPDTVQRTDKAEK